MHSVLSYLKVYPAVMCAAVMLMPGKASATILNFSATLTSVTCSISLNKSTLPLGNVPLGQLRPQQMLNSQPFVLSVENCTGSTGGTDKPIVMIRGDGVRQDNKWLFRNSGSANKVGILVIKSDISPSYSQSEVTNETALPLSVAGEIPANKKFNFYAGVSCGGSSGCTNVGSGSVAASLYFTFEYQ